MERTDLGFLISRLLREIMRRERPLMRQAGLDMWDYAILVALDEGDAPTQSDLATVTGRDKTRLIGNLEGLEARRLITRMPDPADRRNRTVSLTPAGRRVMAACHRRIQAMEEELLAGLSPAERAGFERALLRLVGPGPFG